MADDHGRGAVMPRLAAPAAVPLALCARIGHAEVPAAEVVIRRGTMYDSALPAERMGRVIGRRDLRPMATSKGAMSALKAILKACEPYDPELPCI